MLIKWAKRYNIYVPDEYTNFNFLIIDNDENIAYTNLEHTMNTDSIEEIKESLSVSSNNIYWNMMQV